MRVDLKHPPDGVVPLPEPQHGATPLDSQAWVKSVRRPVTRQLRRPVSDYLAEARELGEV